MKRKKSLKRICLASAGLLTASTASAFTESTIISAQNKTEDSVIESTEQNQEVVLETEVTTEYGDFEASPSSETAATETADVEEPIVDESTEESSSEESSTEASSEENSSDTTEESTSETEESTTDSSTSTSTSESSSSSSTSSSSGTSTSSSSSTSSSTSSSSSTTTSSSKPNKPNKPSKPNKPNKPSVSNNNQQGSTITGNNSSAGIVGPTQVATEYNQTSSTASTGQYGISTAVYYIPRNLTTQAFIDEIGDDAREIAGKNNLYASVMIAQAILESGSGNSALASAPNYNLFGIKGSYEGASVNFLTQEDTGGGDMISIRASFRKYPSYKESLTDYMKLLSGGISGNDSFYNGTWKNKTDEYKDATKFLTGRYATDTSYASKLNSLIEAYELTQYDELTEGSETFASMDKDVRQKSAKTDLSKDGNDEKSEEKLNIIYHIVKKGDSLKTISELYNIPVSAILERNQFERRMIFVGQKLVIPTTEIEEETTVVKTEEIVDRSLRSVQRVINSLRGEQSNEKSSYNLTASKQKSSSVYEVQSGDTLAKISKKTGISVLSLKEWNNLDQYFLTEGQELVLTPPYTTSL
ncbi:LysM peptidoglycan-binding domain-containing protein [Enterococcus sp. BWM-S5]|uniref:Peptidoglycan hydrolase n=1 Tax=Enterococcus larvae TaxID=2794352 RepID=A0ABS4CK69_9ENTE|nr:glucosaminidase domain-containing protein [Enterococcus larvae]MBP1046511.1 LysM peptidoglycan-binding domain-containing protein [Enterococcus larvae]